MLPRTAYSHRYCKKFIHRVQPKHSSYDSCICNGSNILTSLSKPNEYKVKSFGTMSIKIKMGFLFSSFGITPVFQHGATHLKSAFKKFESCTRHYVTCHTVKRSKIKELWVAKFSFLNQSYR